MSYACSCRRLGAIDDLTELESADVVLVRNWSDAVTANGWAPSRMPNAPTDPVGDSGHVGELAARATGAGTSNPNIPKPYVFYLAPLAVRQADKRIADGLASDRSNALIRGMQGVGIVPPGTAIDPLTGQEITGGGLPALAGDLAKYAAYAVGALVLVNMLTRRNPHGQKISRY